MSEARKLADIVIQHVTYPGFNPVDPHVSHRLASMLLVALDALRFCQCANFCFGCISCKANAEIEKIANMKNGSV